MVVCEKCGREYDFDMEPSGLGEKGVLCSRCMNHDEPIGTIRIRASDGFDAIFTNSEEVYRKWEEERGK